MEMFSKKRLGDMLIEEGIINEEKLVEALSLQKVRKTKLGETLVDLGYATEDDIAGALKNQLHIDIIKLQGMEFDQSVLSLINATILRKYNVFPVKRDEKYPNILYLAMSDPQDIFAIDDVSIVTNLTVKPLISTARDINSCIDKYYGDSEVSSIVSEYDKSYVEEEIEEVREDVVLSSPIVVLVKNLMEKAVRLGASDIHIEPFETYIKLRYRIDGILTEIDRYDIKLLSAIIARIKIISGMDISEKRKPQDGRSTIFVDREEYDIRVSNLPTCYGEKVVMRLAAKKALTHDKKNLGFSQDVLERFNRIISSPYGMILVTGPTGSGKSTTLYTTLSELNTENVNIITVEDPVEANIDGINQVQTNPKAGLTFSSALRSILRQDPDIVMIGEIRDAETAEIAVKASITGHLVVSTLHTNSAASTVSRLVNMGVEPYLLADSVVGIIAQRLVRRLCKECTEKRLVEPHEKGILGVSQDEDVYINTPIGCSRCNGSGYVGRIGIYEILEMSSGLKELITNNATIEEIKEKAEEEGMVTLREGAKRLVLNGITSIEELKRVTV